MNLTRCVTPSRRLIAAAAMIGALVTSASAIAQEWPARPVKLVVPFAAGGSADVFGRLVATRLQETFGQSFVI